MKPDALPDLRAAFETLDLPRRRAVQLALCRHALGVWEAYLRGHGPVEYVDSVVVGLSHCVDSALPRFVHTHSEDVLASLRIVWRSCRFPVARHDYLMSDRPVFRLGEITSLEHDDDLSRFAAEGTPPLPVELNDGYIEHDGARIWYATYGSGTPVVLLHGGLGHSGNWGYQVPALVESGYRAVVIDSRGHGRSTRDARPFTYELMASDVAAVLDALHLEHLSFVGWSDGACIALVLAARAPARVAEVFFFACNMDPSGAKPITELSPVLARCLQRHAQDYARLSETPEQFNALSEAVGVMQQTQPNYAADDLERISVPVTIVQSERDEFIWPQHAEYLARTIPQAKLVLLPGVSHFAPLQRPELFNQAVLAFLAGSEQRAP